MTLTEANVEDLEVLVAVFNLNPNRSTLMTKKITITSERGVGDINALIGDRVVACAFLQPNRASYKIHDIVAGGPPVAWVHGDEAAKVQLRKVARRYI